MSGGAAFAVADATQVSEVRRAAQRLAGELGFAEARAGQVALVVTELATNLVKYARGGEILLRGEYTPGDEAIEVVAIDRGPGIGDIAASRRDGFSTSGSAGEGLGAIDRQSDLFDIYSQPSGTAILARLARTPAPYPRQQPRHIAGAVRVNAPGEQVCGDDWSVRIRDERLVAMVVDGLGHGLAAHDAARAAVEAFERLHEHGPAQILDAMHGALSATRGATAAVFAADLERGTASYCGLGNIAAAIIGAEAARHTLVSLPGTVGVGRPRVQEFHYPFPAGSILVMHSDGISAQWDLSSYPGLRARHPSLAAAVLFRDFARRRDDATAIVLKERPRA